MKLFVVGVLLVSCSTYAADEVSARIKTKIGEFRREQEAIEACDAQAREVSENIQRAEATHADLESGSITFTPAVTYIRRHRHHRPSTLSYICRGTYRSTSRVYGLRGASTSWAVGKKEHPLCQNYYDAVQGDDTLVSLDIHTVAGGFPQKKFPWIRFGKGCSVSRIDIAKY